MLINISEQLKKELLENVEIYEFIDQNNIKCIFGKTYGIISKFIHKSGQVYSVLHTIYGSIDEFKNKLDYYMNWSLQVQVLNTKTNESIKKYIHKYGCSETYTCFISPSLSNIKSIPIEEAAICLN